MILPRLQGCVGELRAAGNPAILRPEISGKAAMLGSRSDVLEMARDRLEQKKTSLVTGTFGALNHVPNRRILNLYLSKVDWKLFG